IGIGRDRIERRHAGDLRIGIVHVAVQSLSAQDDNEAVLFHGFDEHLDTGDLHVAKSDREWCTFFGWNSTGTAIGGVALAVDRAEIGADGNVAILELKADTCGLERAAADYILQRVIPEKTKMAGAAAGADA